MASGYDRFVQAERRRGSRCPNEPWRTESRCRLLYLVHFGALRRCRPRHLAYSQRERRRSLFGHLAPHATDRAFSRRDPRSERDLRAVEPKPASATEDFAAYFDDVRSSESKENR